MKGKEDARREKRENVGARRRAAKHKVLMDQIGQRKRVDKGEGDAMRERR